MDELERNQDFMDAGIDLQALNDIRPIGRTAVLERLGPAHFRSKGFSFMGFLQTVYDEVATNARCIAEVPVEAIAEPLDSTDSTVALSESSEVVESVEPNDEVIELFVDAVDAADRNDINLEVERLDHSENESEQIADAYSRDE